LSDVGPDWSWPVYLRVYDRDQVIVWFIARNYFLSSSLWNTVYSIDNRRHHLMISGLVFSYFLSPSIPFVSIFHLLWEVVGLIALWGVSFFWDQGAMPANPLTSSSILGTRRRAEHCSWGVPNLILCTWIVSLFPDCLAYGKSSRYFIFIHCIDIW
jgi:hypothetical protein